ncbi:MAG: hypothetical protein AAF495_19710 [Pseudomonadota bacterium]
MLNQPLAFPPAIPSGYEELPNEPPFDPRRHLALEAPDQRWSLADLGYGPDVIAQAPSPLAVAGPFRILTDEGAQTLEAIASALRKHAQQGSENQEFQSNREVIFLAGGVYRSRFLRDLCACPEIAAFCSALAETPLAPHSLPSQQLYINYAPERMSDDVDIWHADSIGFDYVLLASDPKTFEGGAFEFFLGTRAEAAGLLGLPEDRLNSGAAEGIPADRRVTLRFPSRGSAILQQGNLVVHRARRLEAKGQRVTLVPGLIPLESASHDATDFARIATYGEPGIPAEIARHGAWRAAAKLGAFLERVDMDGDPESQRKALASASADLQIALAALGDSS